MDKGASNTSENELNPTMGNVLSSSSSKPEDSSESANAPTSDSIPSSSSDANISKGATETGKFVKSCLISFCVQFEHF